MIHAGAETIEYDQLWSVAVGWLNGIKFHSPSLPTHSQKCYIKVCLCIFKPGDAMRSQMEF